MKYLSPFGFGLAYSEITYLVQSLFGLLFLHAVQTGQDCKLNGHEDERYLNSLFHPIEDDFSFAKSTSYSVCVQDGVLITANVCLIECLHLLDIIITLTSLNLNQCKHIE